MTLTYKNELGTVTMQGGGSTSPLRVTAIEGLGLVAREYNTAVYSGYDGQETFDSRAVARSITIALEIIGTNILSELRNVRDVFSQSGTLYIKDTDLDRRIKCNQIYLPDVTRVLKGQISTFVVQFTCDSPYFEDAADTSVPLYGRTKLLSSPFTLPCAFGEIVAGANIEIVGNVSVEPIITMYYPDALEGVETITITNQTTGKSIVLNYTPADDDTVTIDVRNRKITSSQNGNIISCLSNNTFLGDFVFKRGINIISVDMGDVTSGFTIECQYNNLYNEAVIV